MCEETTEGFVYRSLMHRLINIELIVGSIPIALIKKWLTCRRRWGVTRGGQRAVLSWTLQRNILKTDHRVWKHK